jgi:hypothetical protein
LVDAIKFMVDPKVILYFLKRWIWLSKFAQNCLD